jgi:hypothetical protein
LEVRVQRSAVSFDCDLQCVPAQLEVPVLSFVTSH